MRWGKYWLVAVIGMVPTALFADAQGFSPATPRAYLEECGSCHVAFPPKLLTAEAWQMVMARLDAHYGTEARVQEGVGQEITAFLVHEAGTAEKLERGGQVKDRALPRLTQTAWFIRKHRKVPEALWRLPQVGRASNCTACHTRAEEGSYREREVVLPLGRQ